MCSSSTAPETPKLSESDPIIYTVPAEKVQQLRNRLPMRANSTRDTESLSYTSTGGLYISHTSLVTSSNESTKGFVDIIGTERSYEAALQFENVQYNPETKLFKLTLVPVDMPTNETEPVDLEYTVTDNAAVINHIPPTANGLRPFCVLRCGGIRILRSLIKALPHIWSPEAYLVAVLADLPNAGIEIVRCVNDKCRT